jgi:hypothetical protein
MARRPRAVTYAEAMTALLDAYQTLRDLLLRARIAKEPRDELLLLLDRLALLVDRDNGRRR